MYKKLKNQSISTAVDTNWKKLLTLMVKNKSVERKWKLTSLNTQNRGRHRNAI